MIVITTPTGDIGHQVLGHITGGTAESIRVIARDPSKLPAQVRERVDVLAGSHGDPAVADAALQGADALFWLVPPDFQATEAVRRYVEFSRPAADAVSRHGVGHVVIVSALGRGYNGDAGLVTASLQMTGLFESTGASTRALANPGFMENMLRNADSIRSRGVVYGTLAADRRLPYVSTRDIAAVAARLLTDRSWLGHADVPLLGPEDLSQDEIAAITSEVLGQDICYQRISLDDLRSQLRQRNASEAMLEAMTSMLAAKDNGLDNLVARTAENSTETSYRQWAQEVLRPAVLG
jgi:uncharacterized protein YbjT (DUF2867 family)